MSSLFGSICLSDIPREQMKKVMCKDGVERIFVNVFIGEKKNPQEFNGRVYTHSISCAPKKEERKDGVNYYFGDLQTYAPQLITPTAEQIEQSPSVSPDEDLPF